MKRIYEVLDQIRAFTENCLINGEALALAKGVKPESSFVIGGRFWMDKEA